jgi:hypothetical protein
MVVLPASVAAENRPADEWTTLGDSGGGTRAKVVVEGEDAVVVEGRRGEQQQQQGAVVANKEANEVKFVRLQGA